ncbi:MAG: hypothetical protein JRE58_11665 [Deltaproteobacteria bacterium]|nr:hypothetical protein [Deltaproteobacteria bacterium]
MLSTVLENIRLLYALAGLCLTVGLGIMLWRVRGILNWKRSLRQELAGLYRAKSAAEGPREEALARVIETCEAIWRSSSPDLNQIRELPDYVRNVATAFFPDEPRPEICLSIGRLLSAAQGLTDHIALLLQRPAFGRLGHLRIRQVHQMFTWYQGLNSNPVFAWAMARRRMINRALHLLRIVLPDPLAWLTYLSRRLTLIMVGRCLLLDLYLFTGQSVMDAFDTQNDTATPDKNQDEQAGETVLEAYEALIKEESTLADPELAAIRSNLVGLPARLWNPPDRDEWQTAVKKAAGLIAKANFPDSTAPLEEATFYVLLDRSRAWLEAMAECRRIAVVKPLYKVSLKQLFQIKAASEGDLMRRTGHLAKGAWTAWRWGRWPIKMLRWIKRRSPASMAGELAFGLACRAVTNYLFRYGFDRACRELEMVYRISREGDEN